MTNRLIDISISADIVATRRNSNTKCAFISNSAFITVRRHRSVAILLASTLATTRLHNQSIHAKNEVEIIKIPRNSDIGAHRPQHIGTPTRLC